MSKSNTTEQDTLKSLLQGSDPSWRANPTLYLALHTADPGEAGNQSTSEATYGGYARVEIVKSTGWTDGGSTFTNATLLQFPQCSGGSNTLTYVSVGVTASSNSQIIYSGALNSSLSVSNLIQPQFSIGSLSITED